MMNLIRVSKKEYAKLKNFFFKIKRLESSVLMKLQEKQKAFDFLKKKGEDVYSLEDLKEVY
ncbi:hypothetical protein HZA97_06395 [Candidatus Woesearchaeota archaeon]|nr:hypothetical protein [Candidatus Woesearchaeota archaeon]